MNQVIMRASSYFNSPLHKLNFGNLEKEGEAFRRREKLPLRESELAHDMWHVIFGNDSSDIGEAQQPYAEYLVRQRVKLGYNSSAEVTVQNFANDERRKRHLKHVSRKHLKSLHAGYVGIIEAFEKKNGKITIQDLEEPTRIGKLQF